MTHEEFEILCRDDVREAIESNIDRSPTDVALDRRIAFAPLVATQVQYLQRAKTKLPSYYAARCILPPRAYEQASAEAVAAARDIAGDSILDLTCGLGVDAAAASRRFARVVAVERDEVLAQVARENMRRMGIRNVEIATASAEDYLAACRERFDVCFCDPDRRDAKGRRRVLLEDCSPDVLALMPAMRRTAGAVALKLSPLFDADEAARLLGDCRVEALSSGGECKELGVYIDSRAAARAAVRAEGGRYEVAAAEYENEPCRGEFDPAKYRFLVATDVALRKMRLSCRYLRGKAYIDDNDGYGFAAEATADPLLRHYEISSIEAFNPKALHREYKGRGITVMKRCFPLSTADILRRTGLREGGDERIAFTTVRGHAFAIRLK